MPLARSQVEGFVGEICELFSIRSPRLSHRRRIRCRWRQATLHLGRRIQRDELAHALAHYFHGELKFADGRPRRGRLHGREYQAWRRLIGNYIAQEFGEGEGVVL